MMNMVMKKERLATAVVLEEEEEVTTEVEREVEEEEVTEAHTEEVYMIKKERLSKRQEVCEHSHYSTQISCQSQNHV